MELNNRLIEKYSHGQLVTTIEDTGTLQRGQISKIQFSRGAINVKFIWRAENSGTPSDPSYVWETVEARDFVIETSMFKDFGMLDNEDRLIPLADCLDSELSAEEIKPLFFWSSAMNERAIFLPPGHATEIKVSDIRMDYIYAICKAQSDHNGEKLICCLNSEALPQFDPKHVVLEVRKKTGLDQLPVLKQELRALAADIGLIDEQGLTSVVNLADKDLQPSVRG